MTETLVMSPPPAVAPTPPAAPTAPATPVAPTGVRRVLLDSAYALTSFPIALAGLLATVLLLAAGLALSVVLGGVLVLGVAVLVARGFAYFERHRIRGMLGRPASAPTYLRARAADGFWRRTLTPLRDPQSWLDVVWAPIGLVTGTVAAALTVAWWSATLGGLSYWYWERFLPRDPDNTTLASLISLDEGRQADVLLQTGIGAFALITLPFAMRFAALLHSSLATVLLCSRAELQGQVAQVAGSRDAARLAEAESMRRLERDIHDGPQQRLVRLTMDLGRAKVQLADNPERAGATLDDALRQARETVDELRSLSRGIAPPLLVDRGLAAAVDEMAAGSPVPVTTVIQVPDRLPPHVETAAYFVVAEALTNVAKHSGARAARVVVVAAGDALEVTVQDDGVGGAHPGKGLGLAGLGQRVAAADGHIEVVSPPGGPTAVRARIPIGPVG